MSPSSYTFGAKIDSNIYPNIDMSVYTNNTVWKVYWPLLRHCISRLRGHFNKVLNLLLQDTWNKLPLWCKYLELLMFVTSMKCRLSKPSTKITLKKNWCFAEVRGINVWRVGVAYWTVPSCTVWLDCTLTATQKLPNFSCSLSDTYS